jgi:hypothetical protein
MVQNFGLRLVTHSLHLPDRTVYGHWNGAAFWSLAQPVSGMVESKSQWYQVYPDTLDKEKWRLYANKSEISEENLTFSRHLLACASACICIGSKNEIYIYT